MRKLRLAATAAAAAPVLLFTPAGVSSAAPVQQASQLHETLTAATTTGAVYLGTFSGPAWTFMAAEAEQEFLLEQGLAGTTAASTPYTVVVVPVIINGVQSYEVWEVPGTPPTKV